MLTIENHLEQRSYKMYNKEVWQKATKKNHDAWNTLVDYAYGVAEEWVKKDDNSLTTVVKYTDLFSKVEKVLIFNTAKRIMPAEHSEELLMKF